MARDCADLRLLLDVLWSPSEARPERTSVVPPRVVRSAQRSALRIAWSDDWAPGCLDEDTSATMAATIARLERAGHIVTRDAPVDLDPEECVDVWGRILGHEVAAAGPWIIRSWPLRALFRLNPTRLVFGPGLFARALSRGLASSRQDYDRVVARRAELIAVMDAFLSRHDAWLTPAAATPAFRHCRTGAAIPVDGRPVAYTDANGPWQVTTPATAHPCLSLPAGRSKEGLPIGVQLHGRRWQDHDLVDVAEVVEHALARA
jgi:amidase